MSLTAGFVAVGIAGFLMAAVPDSSPSSQPASSTAWQPAPAGRGIPAGSQVLDVGLAWSGQPVGFCLLSHDGRQFAAYYDDQRRLTIAWRKLDESAWQYRRLPTSVGWDSHNYIAMTVDDEGLLHLSGNMHCVPLIYFRTERPGDPETFRKIDSMVGREESSCTYPRFMRGPNGRLLFTYRDGRSGNGQQYWNAYDGPTRTWSRLMDEPLFAGGGKMNAYFHGPQLGPDGFYHIAWVWRNTPSADTNHDLSYARSKDLVHWEKSSGEPLALPITVATGEIVDPSPPKGGLLNSNVRMGFDAQRRVILSYTKYDADGNLQIYNARLEDGRWHICQTTDWAYRWAFTGGGSLVRELSFSGVSADRDGSLRQSYDHVKYGSGAWRLDEATLRPVGPASKPAVASGPAKPAGGIAASGPASAPAAAHQRLATDGLRDNWAGDIGNPGDKGFRYALRWQTLDSNRDKPRDVIPPPTMLRLYKIQGK